MSYITEPCTGEETYRCEHVPREYPPQHDKAAACSSVACEPPSEFGNPNTEIGLGNLLDRIKEFEPPAENISQDVVLLGIGGQFAGHGNSRRKMVKLGIEAKDGSVR